LHTVVKPTENIGSFNWVRRSQILYVHFQNSLASKVWLTPFGDLHVNTLAKWQWLW